MRELFVKLRKCWSMLRRLSGDNAYERYLEHRRLHHAQEDAPLDRSAFHRLETERRWNNVRRCC